MHTFNRWEWAEAEFDVPDAGRLRLPIDALALKYGEGASASRKSLMKDGGFHFIDRAAVFYPPTPAEQCRDSLLRADGDTGRSCGQHSAPARSKCCRIIRFSIRDHRSWPELVSGQMQGGIAMGIGHALHEYLPLYEDGPGQRHLELQSLPSAARQRRGRLDADRGSPPAAVGDRSAEREWRRSR